MDIKQLLEKQEQLDLHIINKHKLPYVKLSKKVLAAIVELSEVINDEQKALKYWKVNAEPKATLLEEVADFLHFLASLSNRFNVTAEDIEGRGAIKYKDLDDHFLYMNYTLSVVGVYPTAQGKQKHLLITWSLFKGLLEHLGFTKEQVFEAYLQKHEINYERQASCY